MVSILKAGIMDSSSFEADKNVRETVLAVHAWLTFMTGNIVPVDGGRPLG